MKKILSILAAVGLTATASTAVVSCTSIHNTGKNSLDKDGNVYYKTKNKLVIKQGATLTADGAYFDVSANDLGNVLKNDGKFGVVYYTGQDSPEVGSFLPNTQKVAKASDKPTTDANSVFYKVLASDINTKDIDDGPNGVTLNHEVQVKVYVTVTAGTTDDQGNKAGYKYDEQHFTWMMCVVDTETKAVTNPDGSTTQVTGINVDSFIEASQINIPRNPKADITGSALMSDNNATATISSENMFTITNDQLKGTVKVDDKPVDASIVNGQLVLTGLSLTSGQHTVSSSLFEGTATINL